MFGVFYFHQAFKPSHKEQHICQQITPSVYSTDIYLQDINMVATLQPFQTSMQLPNPGERKSCTNNLNNTNWKRAWPSNSHSNDKLLTKNQMWKLGGGGGGGGHPTPGKMEERRRKSELALITVYPFSKLAAHLAKGLYLLEPYPVLKLFIFTQTNTHWDGGAQGTDVYCKVVPTLYKSGSCAQLSVTETICKRQLRIILR